MRECLGTYRWCKRPRWCCLIKTLRILPINVGRTNVQNPLDFVTALLVDRHKRGRLRHRGAISSGIGSAVGYGIGKAIDISLNKKYPDLTWVKYNPQPLNDKLSYVYTYRRSIVPSISGSLGRESLNRGVQYIYNESQKGSK